MFEYEEETKLKFFDFQAALRADLLGGEEGSELEVKSLSKSLTLKIQEVSSRVWLDDSETTVKKPKSGGKLGAIEEHLDEIVTDVKANLTSLFNRGAQFEQLTEKSENLKTHVSDHIRYQQLCLTYDLNLASRLFKMFSRQLCAEKPDKSGFRARKRTQSLLQASLLAL